MELKHQSSRELMLAVENDLKGRVDSELERTESPKRIKEIKYEDSELVKELKNYTIEPSEKIRRKMDYYYSPYNKKYVGEKFMHFDETVANRMKAKVKFKHDVAPEFKNPIDNKQLVADVLWSKIKNKIFETERPVLEGLKRHVNMTVNPQKDFLTKLDLIDSYPELFYEQNMEKFSDTEIEQLRIFMTKDK